MKTLIGTPDPPDPDRPTYTLVPITTGSIAAGYVVVWTTEGCMTWGS